jgi:hypothetical protein
LRSFQVLSQKVFNIIVDLHKLFDLASEVIKEAIKLRNFEVASLTLPIIDLLMSAALTLFLRRLSSDSISPTRVQLINENWN